MAWYFKSLHTCGNQHYEFVLTILCLHFQEAEAENETKANKEEKGKAPMTGKKGTKR